MMPRAGLLLAERYELRARIAGGGMSDVWRAWDVVEARGVAAKVLRAELTGQEAFLARLRAEARNAARVRHPGIAAVIDSGEQEGSGFLVLELVPGEPLSAILARRTRLPAAEVVPVLAQAARALGAAHDVGVVHRDVKPSNLLLTPVGNLKITDFGISRAVDQAALTAAGMVMGTAQYLSPEQARGRPATPSSDLYALGVVAFECLAGYRPFTGPSQVAIALAHVESAVPPLPDDVPPAVRDVVGGMLAKAPTDRPRTGEELAQALDRLPGGRSPRPLGTLALPESARPPVAAAAAGRPDRPTARYS